jgi:hypothetical protein
MRRSVWASALVVAYTATLPLYGCHKPDDGLSSARQTQAERLDEIAKRTGADWNKLTQADRDYLVNTLGQGSEETAKMILASKQSHFTGARPTMGRPPQQ